MSETAGGTRRIDSHPILTAPARETVTFYWQGQPLTALEGEPVSTALFAHGIRVFGHHAKDHSPQGIFCANGQCSQCTVIADGLAVKSCMEPVREGLRVQPLEGLPELPADTPAGEAALAAAAAKE